MTPPHSPSCLIIGAGIAGLTAAHHLRQAGLAVTLIDKGRRAGGRMATRRLEDAVFDHGAQFITVRTRPFSHQMDLWRSQGLAVEWARGFPTFDNGALTAEDPSERHPRFRGLTGMNSLPQSLVSTLSLHTGERVTHLTATASAWQAFTESGLTFTAQSLLLTAPLPQSLALLGSLSLPAALHQQLAAVQYDRCLAALLLLDGPSLIPPPGGVRFPSGPVAWLADNHLKGISPRPGAVTIHAAPAFSEQYWDAPPEEVIASLHRALLALLGPASIRAFHLHRWRYSQPVNPIPASCLFSAEPLPLAFAGDAFGRPRVEGAALSGLAAAQRLLAHLQGRELATMEDGVTANG